MKLVPWRFLCGVLVLALTALGTTLSSPPRALACSCGVPFAELAWPKQRSTDVARDVVLVIERSEHGIRGIRLVGPDDVEVPLELVRSIPGSGCDGQFTFVRAEARLAASTVYELWADLEAGARKRLAEFTTGTEDEQPRELAPPDIRYFRIPDCAAESGRACDAVAEVRVSGPTAESTGEPSWLRLGVHRGEAPVETLRLSGYERAPAHFYTALDIAADEPCITFEWIDARGHSDGTKSLCEPEKCAIRAPRTLVSSNSCKDVGPNAYGDALWDQVPDDSCDAPPTFTNNTSDGAIHVLDEGQAGCSLALHRRAGRWLACWLVLLSIALRARRRSAAAAPSRDAARRSASRS